MKSISPLFIFILLIALTSSSIAQLDWIKYPENPVLVPGESGTWNEVSGYPFCVLFIDGTYHMWSGGFDGTTPRIGYFSSPDGIIWTPYAENPVLDVGGAGSWDDERVLYPYVLFDGNTFHMWYAGYDGSNVRIGYATSTDKVTWIPYAGNPVMNLGPSSWDNAGIFDPCIHFDGTTYHMWYGGSDINLVSYSIGYATSTDKVTWTKHADNPVLKADVDAWDELRVRAPDVLFDGMIYHMWYIGTTFSSGRHSQVGYATSPDGITWTKYVNNPVLKPSYGSWDSQWVGFSRVLWDSVGTQYKMWYGGGSDDVIGKLGYATAPDTVTALFEIEDIIVPGEYLLHQNYPNPFNPSTTIEFTIPKSEFVELKVYNILGKEVSILVSNKLHQGNHTYTFDGKNLASGIYYYQLVAGDYTEVKKMILLR
jgi:predicted GH43/DUF377 family glycosyl hydrolase